jgi:hypothetical protein
MTGGLIQLVAIGNQNMYINNNPEITFFKTTYQKHTNFAIETKDMHFCSATGFDKKVTCEIKRGYGDMLSHLTLCVELPSLGSNSFSWVNSIGHAMIDYIELEIGGQIIDKQNGEWFEILTELTQPLEKKAAYNEMIGKSDNFTLQNNTKLNLMIPLNFWFCKNIGLALPLVCMYYHEIKLHIKFKSFKECWAATNDSTGNPPNHVSDFKAFLYGEFIWLDLRERLKFVNEPHFYLIEYLQKSNNNLFSKNNNPINVNLCFNNLVKSLYWVIQREDVINQTDTITDETDPYLWRNGNDWFNYSAFRSKKSVIKDTFDIGTLTFNGYNRINEFPAKYFRLYQNYYYHTKSASNFIYTYSFALKPEDYQPTGQCNFSRLKNVTLNINRKKNKLNLEESSEYYVKVYALSYNFLIISNGMAGLLYE